MINPDRDPRDPAHLSGPRLLVDPAELPPPPATEELRLDAERIAELFDVPRYILGLEPPPPAEPLGSVGCPGIDGPLGEEAPK